MRNVNICFFSGDITRSGGTERVALLIANELKKQKKYNVSFVSLTEKKEAPFFYIEDGIERYVLYNREVRGITHILGYVNRLKKVVRQHKIDLIIDIDGIIDMYAIPVKWLTGVKVISWEHFNFYHHPSQKLRALVRKFAVKHLDAIVTLTEQDKVYYLRELKFQCPIEAICNPVTYTGIDNIYAADSKNIISVGRLTYQKGFDQLPDVADQVFCKHPEWRWLVFGEGEDRAYLEKAIKDRGLTDNVKLMGNVNDIDYRYKESAIFVMTSRFEGLPMTLLEAKYYKLPIVSFDIKTGPRECILDGVNGYLIKDGDISAMADKINCLIENDSLRISFSEHTLDDTIKFDLNEIINKWNCLIEKLVEFKDYEC